MKKGFALNTDRAVPEKIRIMFIIDYLLGFAGTENQLFKLIDHLDSGRYDIFLVSLMKTDWLDNYTKNLNCHIEPIGYDVFNHKKVRNVTAFIRLINFIRSKKPQIVLAFFQTSYILGVMASFLAGVKIIISTRRDFGLWLNDHPIIFYKIANLFVDRILTNSYKVKMLTIHKERFDPGKIDVIYNGIELKISSIPENESENLKKKLGIASDDYIVGIVAGLKPMKQHTTFLQAAKIVLREIPNVVFVIVGDGPMKETLQLLTVELKINDSIRFVGDQECVVPYLSIFDVGINCSKNEGLSNAIMEYMAYGVPAIVSEAGGNTELIKHEINGLTFELSNHEQLSIRIITLLNNPSLRRKFVLKSMEYVANNLQIDKIIDQYDNYFKSLVRYTSNKAAITK